MQGREKCYMLFQATARQKVLASTYKPFFLALYLLYFSLDAFFAQVSAQTSRALRSLYLQTAEDKPIQCHMNLFVVVAIVDAVQTAVRVANRDADGGGGGGGWDHDATDSRARGEQRR